MVKEMISKKPILIGVITVIAFYAVSNILSNIDGALTAFLAIGILVGFLVGKDIKNGLVNGAIFGVIGGIIISLILVITYTLYGYGAYLGYIVQGLLISFALYVVVALIGGIIGNQIRKEFESKPVETDTNLETDTE